MSPVTLEAITAKQTELAAMIQQLQAQAVSTTLIEIEGTTITLQPDEHYAGAVLYENGQHKHHLVLMAERAGSIKWQAAVDWATSTGGTLPTRQEQALLYANCKPHLEPVWHWSSETHADDPSCAWNCGFSYGYQDDDHESNEGSAVAVRRV